jgi:hypothetical protein
VWSLCCFQVDCKREFHEFNILTLTMLSLIIVAQVKIDDQASASQNDKSMMHDRGVNHQIVKIFIEDDILRSLTLLRR